MEEKEGSGGTGSARSGAGGGTRSAQAKALAEDRKHRNKVLAEEQGAQRQRRWWRNKGEEVRPGGNQVTVGVVFHCVGAAWLSSSKSTIKSLRAYNDVSASVIFVMNRLLWLLAASPEWKARFWSRTVDEMRLSSGWKSGFIKVPLGIGSALLDGSVWITLAYLGLSTVVSGTARAIDRARRQVVQTHRRRPR